MAGRSFCGVRVPADWRRRVAGVGLIAIGVAGVGSAGWAYYDAWSTRQQWEASPEAAALERLAAEPSPIWIEATPQPASTQHLVPVPAQAAPPLLISPEVTPTPVVTATADQLSLDSADFRFLDPPEPGAHARVAVTVANHANVSSGRVLLGIDSSWFDTYSIIGTGPAVSADRTNDDGLRTFSFPPVAAGASVTYELHVTSTEEGTRAPMVKVLLENGELIGEAGKLVTLAPQPRPGPVMSIDIPRLKLQSRVVQTAWEPPPYNVGQIKGTANITQGNTVLIGHLTGAAGNVFAHLDQLQPGDEVTTMSRGLPYKFVVSQVFERPNNDAAPMEAADEAKLTLMTCAGVWNPFTHDYSERLWVIAEPPEQAEVTIANAAATATATAATATAEAAITETAVALLPTATPVPTPYAGEPSLPGGIGNHRANLEKAFGYATGETSGKLVVFRQPSREIRVRFTPDPPRAALVAEFLSSSLTFDAALREARKLFPTDTEPRAAGPEGNNTIVVERFSSPTLEQALGTADFTVLYLKDPQAKINTIILGAGDDVDAILADLRR